MGIGNTYNRLFPVSYMIGVGSVQTLRRIPDNS